MPLKTRKTLIFDECHRSQFGDNHQTIKEFFPNAQLFGFTGTPIFEENASYRRIEGDVQTLKTTQDLFQQERHAYTITHAIEDRNVLRFQVDYYKREGVEAEGRKPSGVGVDPSGVELANESTPDGSRRAATTSPKPGETLAKRAVVDAILAKHGTATGDRRFNAILATASINDAIEYYALFDALQNGRQITDPDFVPLNITAVLSPPADVSPDVRQIQEDLPQEQEDNKHDPDGKKKALSTIIAH